jgi:hypothetical protein
MTVIYLPIPCDFSVAAVNTMLEKASVAKLGPATRVDYLEDWEWCIRFRYGVVWSSYKHNEMLAKEAEKKEPVKKHE